MLIRMKSKLPNSWYHFHSSPMQPSKKVPQDGEAGSWKLGLDAIQCPFVFLKPLSFAFREESSLLRLIITFAVSKPCQWQVQEWKSNMFTNNIAKRSKECCLLHTYVACGAVENDGKPLNLCNYPDNEEAFSEWVNEIMSLKHLKEKKNQPISCLPLRDDSLLSSRWLQIWRDTACLVLPRESPHVD